MVQVNIGLPDELHRKLKILAVTKDKSLKQYVIEILEEAIKRG